MARKRQNERSLNTVDLAQEIGLTRMVDSKSADVSNWLPTELPQIDWVLGGGIPFGRVNLCPYV